MSNWAAQILFVNTNDPDIRRRGGILIGVSLAMTAMALVFIPIVITATGDAGTLALLIAAAILFSGAAYLGRLGKVSAGGFLVVGMTILAILVATYTQRSTPSTPLYLVLAILLSGVLLPPVQIWSVLAVTLIGVAATFGMLPPDLRDNPMWALVFRGAPLLLIMSALLMFVSARSVTQALATAQVARAAAESASVRLAESNASLEARVAERTAELTRVFEEQQRTTRQLEESLAAQRDMNRVIADLSVPIIPISSESLVVPLVGAIDSSRAEQLLGNLLSTIEATRSRTIILDVTGVAVVDTQVAASLLRVAAASGLMGAQTVLVGIRPEVAQTLIGLGVDLNAIRTAASLQDGLALIGSR